MSIWVALQVKQDKKNPNQKQLFYTSGAHVHYLHTSSTNLENGPGNSSWMEWSITSRVIFDHHNIWEQQTDKALLLHVRDVAFTRKMKKAIGDLTESD